MQVCIHTMFKQVSALLKEQQSTSWPPCEAVCDKLATQCTLRTMMFCDFNLVSPLNIAPRVKTGIPGGGEQEGGGGGGEALGPDARAGALLLVTLVAVIGREGSAEQVLPEE